jgi:hypothetical protein
VHYLFSIWGTALASASNDRHILYLLTTKSRKSHYEEHTNKDRQRTPPEDGSPSLAAQRNLETPNRLMPPRSLNLPSITMKRRQLTNSGYCYLRYLPPIHLQHVHRCVDSRHTIHDTTVVPSGTTSLLVNSEPTLVFLS